MHTAFVVMPVAELAEAFARRTCCEEIDGADLAAFSQHVLSSGWAEEVARRGNRTVCVVVVDVDRRLPGVESARYTEAE